MGAWGTGLYSDDTTCDVRDSYVAALQRGASDAEATEAVLGEYAGTLRQHEVACLVYFALADTQWKYGRLEAAIRERALELLEQGGDAAVWERDAPGKDARARSKVLDALRRRLHEPPPPRKPVKIVRPKPKRHRTDAPVGSVFLLPLAHGQFAALALVGHYEGSRWIDPVFSVLDWRGAAPPAAAQLTGDGVRTVSLRGATGTLEHIGFLEVGERENTPLADLVATDIVLEEPLPFNPWATGFTSVSRQAERIEAALRAAGT